MSFCFFLLERRHLAGFLDDSLMVLLSSTGQHRLPYPCKEKDITTDEQREMLSLTQGSSLHSFSDSFSLKYVNGLRYLLGLSSACDIWSA